MWNSPSEPGGVYPRVCGGAAAWGPPPGYYPVYPRVCGGATVDTVLQIAEQGLSPRVRGSRLKDSYASRQNRSIPACAGEPTTRGLVRT